MWAHVQDYFWVEKLFPGWCHSLEIVKMGDKANPPYSLLIQKVKQMNVNTIIMENIMYNKSMTQPDHIQCRQSTHRVYAVGLLLTSHVNPALVGRSFRFYFYFSCVWHLSNLAHQTITNTESSANIISVPACWHHSRSLQGKRVTGGSDPVRWISLLITPAAITQLSCSVVAPDIWS